MPSPRLRACEDLAQGTSQKTGMPIESIPAGTVEPALSLKDKLQRHLKGSGVACKCQVRLIEDRV